jgi:hypothetical protein
MRPPPVSNENKLHLVHLSHLLLSGASGGAPFIETNDLVRLQHALKFHEYNFFFFCKITQYMFFFYDKHTSDNMFTLKKYNVM